MTDKRTVQVVRDSKELAATPTQRAARGLTFACFFVLLGGLGLWDLGQACFGATDARALVLAKGSELAPDVDPDWIDESPEPIAKKTVPERMLLAWSKLPQLMFLCEINEALLTTLWRKDTGLTHVVGPGAPRDYDVFSSPDGDPFPRFRYPPSTTMPDGLTTNAFGFRGPEITLVKPARTVRIAFVGASSTVDGHHFAWSFPELVQHWLNLWAGSKSLDVRFETINAGREAIGSTDIRAIVEYETLPLAADYIVYYEGQNQFGIHDLLRHVRVEDEFTPGQPADELLLDLAMADRQGRHWTDKAAAHSATIRRLRRLLGVYDDLDEPAKPAQLLTLPAGLDEQNPDLALAPEMLQLARILGDLDAIRRACDTGGARLVLCSFDRLAHAGLRLGLKESHSLYANLNRNYWPLTYEHVQQLSNLQNRFFAAWAREHAVPFLDVAAWMPDDPTLFTDMVHATELGSRLRAWVIFCGLLPILEADLAAGRTPAPDQRQNNEHPYRKPARRVTADELNRK